MDFREPRRPSDWLGPLRALCVLSLFMAAFLLVRATWSRGAPAEVPILVEIGGDVDTPGLYTVRRGATVAEALRRAGWSGSGGGPSLSREVQDGQRLIVTAAGVEIGQPGQRLLLGLPLDLNTATADDLQAIPGIGPRTAADIVAWRVQVGGFGALDELTQVSGIGDATLERLRPFLDVTPAPSTGSSAPAPPGDGAGGVVAAHQEEVEYVELPLSINRATFDQLTALPGVGPVKARAILAERETGGDFSGPADLQRVHGIGPVLAARMADFISFSSPAVDPPGVFADGEDP